MMPEEQFWAAIAQVSATLGGLSVAGLAIYLARIAAVTTHPLCSKYGRKESSANAALSFMFFNLLLLTAPGVWALAKLGVGSLPGVDVRLAGSLALPMAAIVAKLLVTQGRYLMTLDRVTVVESRSAGQSVSRWRRPYVYGLLGFATVVLMATWMLFYFNTPATKPVVRLSVVAVFFSGAAWIGLAFRLFEPDLVLLERAYSILPSPGNSARSKIGRQLGHAGPPEKGDAAARAMKRLQEEISSKVDGIASLRTRVKHALKIMPEPQIAWLCAHLGVDPNEGDPREALYRRVERREEANELDVLLARRTEFVEQVRAVGESEFITYAALRGTDSGIETYLRALSRREAVLNLAEARLWALALLPPGQPPAKSVPRRT